MTTPADACPCGIADTYATCCEPLHDGGDADTARRLMQARYCAYARGHMDYVFRTWHPRTRPDDIAPAPGVQWAGLTIHRVVDGEPDDATGVVEFTATYVEGGDVAELHEVSEFSRRAGRWVYVQPADS